MGRTGRRAAPLRANAAAGRPRRTAARGPCSGGPPSTASRAQRKSNGGCRCNSRLVITASAIGNMPRCEQDQDRAPRRRDVALQRRHQLPAAADAQREEDFRLLEQEQRRHIARASPAPRPPASNISFHGSRRNGEVFDRAQRIERLGHRTTANQRHHGVAEKEPRREATTNCPTWRPPRAGRRGAPRW